MPFPVSMRDQLPPGTAGPASPTQAMKASGARTVTGPAYGSAWLSGRPGQPRPAGAGMLCLVALPTAPFWARRYTHQFLDGRRQITVETTQTAELVVSELVTNSVLFCGGRKRTLPQPQPSSGRTGAPLIPLSLRYFRVNIQVPGLGVAG